MCPKPNLLQVEEVESKSLKSVLCCYNFETSFIYLKIFLNSTVLVHEDPVVKNSKMFPPEGMVSASKESVSYVLNNEGGGHASIIVIGGAEEALNAHPGSLTLNILKRKGFIKMALKHG